MGGGCNVCHVIAPHLLEDFFPYDLPITLLFRFNDARYRRIIR